MGGRDARVRNIMKFKIDENLPVEVAKLLQQAGHDALTVWDQALTGSPDPEIADACQREGRCLFTLDKDFADILTYPPEQFAGLMILRVKYQDKRTIIETVEKLLTLFPHHPVEQHLWIVDERRVRIRGRAARDIISGA